jgi:peptide/nickel transport system substrate-binding protein
MKLRISKRALVATVAVAGIATTGLLAPAHSATRSTVVIHQTNAFTSLNTGTPDTNLTTNTDVAYLTGSGFNYYDDKKSVIKNTTFGSYSIVKNTKTDFRTKWTVAPGRVWSDGTPITGEDLLLGIVLNSSAYSIKAGLGDPNDEKNPPVFNSISYGGTFDNHIVGLPVLSADKQSVTLQFDAPIPNWDLYGPGVSPVHTLVALANGKTSLLSASEAAAAKSAFATAVLSYDTATLKKYAKVWNDAYNITKIDSSTNPNLLVGNGGFIVSSAVTDQSITLKANPKYNSGPKVTGGIDTIVMRFISDGTAATQALSNGEIDLYQGQATADAVSQLKAMKGVTVLGGTNACYEHIDLRTNAVQGSKDVYKGIFADSNPAGKALRQAFLMAYPREEIVAKIVKPVNSNAVVPASTFVMPGQSNYGTVAAGNGSAKYSSGTQEQRTAAALKIVKRYYPGASASNPLAPVRLEQPSPNARRAAEAALVVPALAKAGFKVTAVPTTGWSGKLDNTEWDAEFYAWCPSAVLQTGTNDNFLASGGNNHMGWNVPALDKALRSLEIVKSDTAVTRDIITADRIVQDQGLSLAIFQHPAVTAYNSTLKGVKPAPLSPNLVWNYWDWTY